MGEVSGFGRVLLKNAAIGLVSAGVLLGVTLLSFHHIPVRQQTESAVAFFVALTVVCTVSEWVRSRKSAGRRSADRNSVEPVD